MKEIKWTFEEIQQLIKDNNIIYYKVLRKNFSGAYDAAYRNGWLDKLGLQYLEHPTYTYEEAYKIASKYTKIKDFRRENGSVYSAAWKNGWLASFDWLQRGIDVFTDNIDCCYMYLNEQLKIVYVGRTYRQSQRRTDHKIGKTNIKEEFEKRGVSFPEPIYYMNDAKFPVNYGLMIEDKLVEWFKKEGWTVLNKAKTGIKCGSAGGQVIKWKNNEILKAAAECKDMQEFYTKYPVAYRKALDLGIDVGLEFQVKPNGYWFSKDNCKKEASKYKSITDFSKYSYGAYRICLNNSWLDEFFPKRQKRRNKDDRAVKMFSMDGEFIKEFNSPKEAADFLKLKEYSTLSKCLNKYNGYPSAFGYKWEYKKGS